MYLFKPGVLDPDSPLSMPARKKQENLLTVSQFRAF